jgi:hypothetical protein
MLEHFLRLNAMAYVGMSMAGLPADQAGEAAEPQG